MDDFFEADQLLQISIRIDEMRKMYSRVGYYEKYFIKQEAQRLQTNLNRAIGRLKSKMKKKYYFDDFMVLVITNVF